jgi:hypothetical protein
VTVLIGFSCPQFTIIGADGRGIAVTDPTDIDDNCQKIFKTGFGVIAGAGRTDITYAVAARLETEAARSNHEVSGIIQAEVAALGLAADDPGLERTSWLGSYFAADGTGTRLALAARDLNYSFDPFRQNHVVLIRPADMSAEMDRALRESAQQQLNRQLGPAPADAHLPICINMIASLVRTISRHCHSVGPRCSVGVHLAETNATAVSAVGDDTDALVWH